MTKRLTKWFLLCFLCFGLGYGFRAYKSGDLSNNHPGSSGWLYSWQVIDMGGPVPMLVCSHPYVDEVDQVIVCVARGE